MSVYPLLPSTPQSPSQYPPESVEGYAHLLSQVLLDGTVSPGEKRLIDEHRQQNKISMETHKMALQTLNWTEENWEAAIEMGKENNPDELYGGAKCNQVHYIPKLHEKTKPIYLNGLIVAPHLRQWYTFSETGERELFWREKEERKASPLELFLDLLFVTTIYKLSSAMELQPFSALTYIILYCSFWRVWVGITSYSTRYEHEDWLHPLAYCTTMLGALFMTAEIRDTYGLLAGHLVHPSHLQLRGFAISFVFASFPLFVLYALATITELSGKAKFIISDKPHLNRRTTYHPLQMLIALTISLIPWIISAAIGTSDPIPYWGSSLLFMEITTRIIDSYNHWTAPICVEHWGERCSLFIMLHLGESMFAIAFDFTGTMNSYLPFIATFFGLVIPFAFRRVYFEIEGREPKDPHALRHWLTLHLYTFLNLVLCLVIVAYAIGFSGLQAVNVASFGRDFNVEYYTSLDVQGELESLQEASTEDITQTNITCAADQLTDLQLYYLYREDQKIFCITLAVMMLSVAIQTLLSKTAEEYQNLYVFNHSQYWRVGIRIVFLIILFSIPAISRATLSIDAFQTICIGGSFYFTWALLESCFVLRKMERKHHLRSLHAPHYVEMSSM